MRVWDFKNDEFLTYFTHSPSFQLNEWIYIGVSFFRTNRIEDLHNIHIVSKTQLGIENQDIFSGISIPLIDSK